MTRIRISPRDLILSSCTLNMFSVLLDNCDIRNQSRREGNETGMLSMLLYKVKRSNVNNKTIYCNNDGKFTFTECIELNSRRL